jgi:RNA polymerase-binding transcription factor DksA
VPLRSAPSPRKRLLVHLSQAVETLSLRTAPDTFEMELKNLQGNVKIQSFEVTDLEFAHFENVSNALIRLDQGTYGRCMVCGGRIHAEVLSGTPWATRCLECGDRKSRPQSA